MTINEKAAKKKSSNTRQRTMTLRCRALPDEAARIKKLAKDLGMSVSETLRSATLSAKIRRPRKQLPSPDRQVLAQLTGQLGMVGSNLNQIARIVNRERCLDAETELSTTLSDCRKLIEKLSKLLA